MKKALLVALVVVATAVSCAQVDPDTYKKPGHNYSRSDGWYQDSSYNTYLMVNGSSVGNISSAGAMSGFDVAVNTITTTSTLTAADCGEVHFVTAGIDTKTITLPATIAGCTYTFVYNGADGGALVDISPAAADAVHGSCTLAGSVLEFNGTDDNDIGLTKATVNTADTITLVGDGSAGWYVTACAGIWANN